MQIRKWTYEELILAFNLYCKTAFGRMHSHNPDIVELAEMIDRSSNAIALKLCNFASFDDSLRKRGITGMRHTSKKDKDIWDEYYNDWGKLVCKSELLLEKYRNKPLNEKVEELSIKEGKDVDRLVKARLNQSFFRKTILASYDNRCCITGISIPELIIASHIVPWAVDKENRLNPHNGICFNALHDRAFDAGLITLSNDFKLIVSESIKTGSKNATIDDFIIRFEGIEISLPSKFKPYPEFLDYHRKEIFKK